MTTLLTAQADDAHRAAYDDRAAHADLLLDLAVKEAIDWLRAGKPGYAEYRLTRAAMAAERILGPTSVAGVNAATLVFLVGPAWSEGRRVRPVSFLRLDVPAPATTPSGGAA
jgi:hypothetical protein